MKLAVSQRCSIKYLFRKASQNSEVNKRSSYPELFCQKVVLKIFAKFTGNITCTAGWWKPPTKQPFGIYKFQFSRYELSVPTKSGR